ncbi:Bro-N domain-containing protein [Desulfovibrio fairfieldensis]|uniref:BRO-N domain-containing protein n=1 Tax=Desulfovibrio fairfieldensis TaxID=44742 RepID=UPI001F22FFFD|nr:Bro-N domain-containing protein [Desulfovibrio fairfieldensis]
MAKDVCEVLGLGNVTEALRGLDEDEKGVHIIDTPGGKQEMTIISESGLYALVFRSHKPEAHVFSKWVRGDVLPAYRQNGFVGTPPQSRVGPLPRPRPCLKCSFNPASARKAT